MKLIYTTLNSNAEAATVGRAILEKKIANCVNYFPITCMYNYAGKITEEPEVVLIIKTLEGKYDEIQKVIKQHISYENFIGELSVDKINSEFENWICGIVK